MIDDDAANTRDLRVRLVAGAERLTELHAAELPQKNELCGAFWGTLALRAAAIGADGEPVDQDTVGVAAGTAVSGSTSDVLPRGEVGRTDYRVSFPIVEDSMSGTSAAGLLRALRELSSESVTVLPIAGPWSADAVEAVLHAAATCRQPCTPIANLATRHLWGSRPSPPALLRYLLTGDPESGPPPDWDVGHFVGLLGAVHGPRGTLVIVGDTYRSLGWEGVHFQPIQRMADALARKGSGQPSGILLMSGPDDAAHVSRRVRDAGLEIRTWDNGSVDLAAHG